MEILELKKYNNQKFKTQWTSSIAQKQNKEDKGKKTDIWTIEKNK